MFVKIKKMAEKMNREWEIKNIESRKVGEKVLCQIIKITEVE